MYTRYIPQPDGSYRRSRMPDPPQPPRRSPAPPRPPAHTPEPPPPPPCETEHKEEHGGRQESRYKQPGTMSAGSFLKQLLPKDLDTGDLIVILLLLLMAGDCAEEQNTAMLTLALYLFM